MLHSQSKIQDLRHRVTVQTATETRDTFGQISESWAALATRWASIEALTGIEAQAAAQMDAIATHRVRMRYLEDVTPLDRVIFGTRTFNIVHVVNVSERDDETELLCREDV